MLLPGVERFHVNVLFSYIYDMNRLCSPVPFTFRSSCFNVSHAHAIHSGSLYAWQATF